MKLSIVATLYRSAPYILEFHKRASDTARQFSSDDYEIVFVNDGSPDDSLALAISLADADSHVVVVDLSRNFGHHKAMMAGLEQARGDFVFLIDSDLEESPEWLVMFAETLASECADVVYGRQAQRKGSWFERWSGELYYSLFNWLCNIDHPRNIVTARLMTRRYVESLLRFRERELVISCLWVLTGFKQCEMVVKKLSRGESSYSLSRRVAHAVNVITSFSEVPLRLIFSMGVSLFTASFIYGGYLVFNRMFRSQFVDGWTSVMVSIWLLGGMIASFIGVVGIYLAKIFSEIKQRPLTIVRHIYGQRQK